MTCEYSNICLSRINDDLCRDVYWWCSKKKQFDYEKQEKIKEQQRSTESWVTRLIENGGKVR